MAEALLKIERLVKRFGGIIATDALTLAIYGNELHAVIGPNGAGKTTLIGQLTGEIVPDEGHIEFAGMDVTRIATPKRSRQGLARSFQITSVFQDLSALDNVALAVQAHAGHSFRFWRPARRIAALREPAKRHLAAVGLSSRADTMAAALSHGEKRQLEISMALATMPRLLLLDEPMAGMSPDESAKMVSLLRKLKGQIAILLVEHDMDVVFALADRITVLVYGRAVASGTPDEIRRNADVRRAYLGESDAP